jgi:hypothetical protein
MEGTKQKYVKGRDDFEYLGLEWRMILKWALKE